MDEDKDFSDFTLSFVHFLASCEQLEDVSRRLFLVLSQFILCVDVVELSLEQQLLHMHL